jgi:Fic family protein
LIVSYDTIMKPPYEITPTVLQLISSISEKIGEVNAHFLNKPSPQLRKENKIKTIHSSLQIEGNTLTESQITDLIENKRIIGPAKDILEVQNAIQVYNNIKSYKAISEKSFLQAHQQLMQGLISKPGSYRLQGIGIIKGSKEAHVAPSAHRVKELMKALFQYLKNDKDLSLIKSCVFHYELEFIHPFIDGNGRMGRLWQTVILMQQFPVFEFLPFETLINKTQKEYYAALTKSDQLGQSTPFIEYMLHVIHDALNDLLNLNSKKLTDIDRIEYFVSLKPETFTRKDYMHIFKSISTATASRDLKKGIALKLWECEGTGNSTIYKVKK